MNFSRKSFIVLLGLLGLLFISSLMNMFLLETFMLNSSLCSTCYLLFLSVAIYLYFDWTLVQGAIKKSLLLCAVLFTAMFVLRGSRYVAFVELDQVMRYLWYLYYIPCIFVSYFSLRAAVSIGKPDGAIKPNWLKWMAAFSGLLTLVVLTNDFHQLVFKLNPGFWVHWIDEYDYGFMYYVVFAWISLLLFGSFGIMIMKCRVSNARKYIWIPLMPAILGTAYLIMIVLGVAPHMNGHLIVEFPEAFCFTIATCWICCIQIGFVPANKSYEDLFHLSSVHATITDKNEKIIYSSELVAIKEAEDSKDILVRREEIPGGYVYWQSDISELNRMQEELEDMHEQLEEEAELIRLENELKEKNTSIEAKNKVYDAIAVRVHKQSQMITSLSQNTEKEPEKQKHNLQMICLYGSYIKRMSNLMLLSNQKEKISDGELALAIEETLRYLSRMDVASEIFFDGEAKEYDAEDIINGYESFGYFIEQTLQDLIGVYVTVKQGICKMILECKKSNKPNPLQNTTVEYDEDTLFISILLSKGGMENDG